MEVVLFLFLVATAFCQATAQVTDGLNAEAVKETDEESNFDIQDENGNLVSQAEIFSNLDFQVERPVEGKVCLLKNKTDTSTCYKQDALTFAVPPSVWTFCEGRKITVLEAIECEAELEQERDVIDEILHRRTTPKYKTVCLWQSTYSTSCVQNKCCAKGWWFGAHTCTRHCCERHETKKIWTEACVEGYTRRF